VRALKLAAAVCVAAIVPAHAVETIRCDARPEQSYELYLPSDYPSDRTWPILYMLDPRSRGRVSIEIYREAAERYGYILASSNNMRSDGPARTNFDAMQAMLDDTFARYRLDPRRLYAVGMSGGARAACEIAAKLAGQMPGVILVGATCPPQRRLRKKTPFDVFGIVGDIDFNFLEMQEFDDALERLGLKHRLITFEGRHGWHGGAEADRALEWLELRAIARKLRADENGFVEARYESALAAAREADAAGRPVDAWRNYQEVLQGFAGVRPLEEVRDRFVELGKNR
jgi:predicted esterase